MGSMQIIKCRFKAQDDTIAVAFRLQLEGDDQSLGEKINAFYQSVPVVEIVVREVERTNELAQTVWEHVDSLGGIFPAAVLGNLTDHTAQTDTDGDYDPSAAAPAVVDEATTTD